MKKKRYSKPERKEVPSRRKLAMEMAKADILALRLRNSVEAEREGRRTLGYRVESLREENERLKKQVEEMMPPDRFLYVAPSRGFRRGEVEDMMRVQTMHLPVACLVVEVGIEHFQMMEGRNAGAYKEALADHIARQARKVVLDGLVIR